MQFARTAAADISQWYSLEDEIEQKTRAKIWKHTFTHIHSGDPSYRTYISLKEDKHDPIGLSIHVSLIVPCYCIILAEKSDNTQAWHFLSLHQQTSTPVQQAYADIDPAVEEELTQTINQRYGLSRRPRTEATTISPQSLEMAFTALPPVMEIIQKHYPSHECPLDLLNASVWDSSGPPERWQRKSYFQLLFTEHII